MSAKQEFIRGCRDLAADLGHDSHFPGGDYFTHGTDRGLPGFSLQVADFHQGRRLFSLSRLCLGPCVEQIDGNEDTAEQRRTGQDDMHEKT